MLMCHKNVAVSVSAFFNNYRLVYVFQVIFVKHRRELAFIVFGYIADDIFPVGYGIFKFYRYRVVARIRFRSVLACCPYRVLLINIELFAVYNRVAVQIHTRRNALVINTAIFGHDRTVIDTEECCTAYVVYCIPRRFVCDCRICYSRCRAVIVCDNASVISLCTRTRHSRTVNGKRTVIYYTVVTVGCCNQACSVFIQNSQISLYLNSPVAKIERFAVQCNPDGFIFVYFNVVIRVCGLCQKHVFGKVIISLRNIVGVIVVVIKQKRG